MYIIDLVIRTPVQLCAFQQSEQLKARKIMLKPTLLKKYGFTQNCDWIWIQDHTKKPIYECMIQRPGQFVIDSRLFVLNCLLLFLSADKSACRGFSRKWDLSHCSRTGQTFLEMDRIVAHVGDHMERNKWRYHNKILSILTWILTHDKLLVAKRRHATYCILNKYTTHHVAKVTGNSKQVIIGKKKRKCGDRPSSLPLWITVGISELSWYVHLIQVCYCILFYN